jgi:DNA polymerase III gamma/tau subunit
MSVLFDEILAQDGPLSTLKRALEKQRVAQAYLFEGPGGVGKEKAALALASTMLCSDDPKGCGRCNTCRRIANNTHPDVRVFRPREEGDRNIQIEFVRETILPFARFAPFEANTALVIFPQADVSFPAQHAEAANALLKTLEEPRENLHFVLLAERPDRLLTSLERDRYHPLKPGRARVGSTGGKSAGVRSRGSRD